MNRRAIVGVLATATIVGGLAAPSFAGGGDDSIRRVCVVLTDDPNNRGPAPLCVWIPDPKGQDDKSS